MFSDLLKQAELKQISPPRINWLTGVQGGNYIRLFRQISLYHAINPVFGQKYLEFKGDSRMLLVRPQGYDPEFFHPVTIKEKTEYRAKIGMPETGLSLLCSGSVIPRKGFRELFSMLAGIHLDFRLYILGEYNFPDGHFLHPYEEDAREIKQFGEKSLGDKIVFTGPLQNVNEYMQAADIFLLPSTEEGLPNVLLEAMACGCVVICRDLPGIRGYMVTHNETGIIYQGTEELQSQIMRLSVDPELRLILGERAAEFVLQNASFEVVWNNLKLLLSEQDESR